MRRAPDHVHKLVRGEGGIIQSRRYIPVMPVSQYTDRAGSDGALVGYMFPADGTISKAKLWIGRLEHGFVKIRLEVKVINVGGEVISMHLTIPQGCTTLPDLVELKEGNKMLISVDDANPHANDAIRDFMMAFIYTLHAPLEMI